MKRVGGSAGRGWHRRRPSPRSPRRPSGLPVPILALDSNAICVPSGDQAGAESNAPGTSNRIRRSLPSAAIDSTARSVSPRGDFTDANRKRLASGEIDGIELMRRRVEQQRLVLAVGVHRPQARDAGRAAPEQQAAAVRPPGRLARGLPLRRDREPRVVLAGCRHARDLEVRGLPGLADAVRDVASVRRPVRLRVVLGVGGQLPQVRPVVVDAEDVPGGAPSRKLENAMRPLKTSACAAAGAARMVPAASAASARDLMATPSGFGEWNYFKERVR